MSIDLSQFLSKEMEELFPLFEAGREWMPKKFTPLSMAMMCDMVRRHPNMKILVLREKGKPIGVAWCEILVTNDLFIHYIFAHKKGRKLMNKIEEVAKENKCDRIAGATLRDENFTRKVFVKKYGYNIVGFWLAKEIK